MPYKVVAGSVWLSLFMDGTVKCKLRSTPSRTGLSRIQNLKWTGTNRNIETSADVFIWQISWNFNVTRKCHSMKSGIWSPSKKCVCPKRIKKKKKKIGHNLMFNEHISIMIGLCYNIEICSVLLRLSLKHCKLKQNKLK
jgi:hypothetical protein